MTEKLLQYIWNFRLFSRFDFTDTDGNALEILDFGKWNQDSGPDFLFGKIKTKGTILAGNIELHLRSSDWIFHHHSENPEFENVILHVVFLHDCEVEELSNRNIPTLELKNLINSDLLWKYELMLQENLFIPCEKIFNSEKMPVNFCESTLLRKLDEKSEEIEVRLSRFKNDYEAVLFHQLAYAFGLKVNAEIFRQIAENIDFSVVRKISNNPVQLHALLYGKSGFLNVNLDDQMKIWKQEYDFIKNKFQIPDVAFSPKFLRLRPPNFPTIRLSQLANLIHQQQGLFSKIIHAENISELYDIFRNIKADSYWNCRFNFGKISETETEKMLTKDFIDLVIINAVLPLKYTYHKRLNENTADEIMNFYREILPEKNTIVRQWEQLNVKINSALESQAFLYHYRNNCISKKCLNCGIGLELLRVQ
ncbi:MAG: DUF2851 family protein [Bergeyella sp.]